MVAEAEIETAKDKQEIENRSFCLSGWVGSVCGSALFLFFVAAWRPFRPSFLRAAEHVKGARL